MIRVRLNYYDLTIPEKIQLGYGILSAMADNPHFPDAGNALKDFEDAVKKLEDAHQAARHGDRVKNALMVLANESMDMNIAGFGGYVQNVSKGDEEKVLSSGFEPQPKITRSSPQPMAVPAFLQAKPGRLEGEIFVNWERVIGARSYTLQVSEDNGETWEDCDTCTKSKLTVAGRTPGSRIWFRVAAFGPLGYSAWSDAVQGKVAA